MPERTYLVAMDDLDRHSTFVAQDAAKALTALGWPVSPSEDDSDTWRIGYFILTDEELIGLANANGSACIKGPTMRGEIVCPRLRNFAS